MGSLVNSFDSVCVRENQKLEVMIDIFSQDFSYNRDFCTFFIVYEVVCGLSAGGTCPQH